MGDNGNILDELEGGDSEMTREKILGLLLEKDLKEFITNVENPVEFTVLELVAERLKVADPQGSGKVLMRLVERLRTNYIAKAGWRANQIVEGVKGIEDKPDETDKATILGREITR